jgi:predicted transcriptional regulator
MYEEEYVKILKILYEQEDKEPGVSISSDNLKLQLDMTYHNLLSNFKYLKAEGYIELKEFYGDDFETKITKHGIEFVKNIAEE